MNPLQIAYVRIPGNAPGKRIGIVKYNEMGYYPCDYDQPRHTTNEQVDEHVAILNEQGGITPEVSDAMLSGSMFGWHVPAAKAAHDFFAKETPVVAKD